MPNKIINALLQWVERLTGYLTTITSDHAYIHAGLSFSIALDLGSISSAYYVILTTPASSTGKYVHFRPSASGITTDANSVEFTMQENITSYTGGTSYTPFNRNRLSTNISSCVIKYGITPTVGSPVLLDTQQVGSTGIPGARHGGSTGGNDEIIFKPETTYLFTFTPGGATNCSFNTFWYEETGY